MAKDNSGTVMVAFVIGAIAFSRSERGRPVPFVRFLLLAFVFVACSYAPYLALKPENASPYWRTQFFAAPASAIFIASFFNAVDRLLRARHVLATLGCAAAIGCGL